MSQRKIKFRAWDKEEKEMIPANAWYFSEDFEPFIDSVERSQNYFEIMQFIGFKDDNGVEIYEGDIIKLNELEWDESEDLIHRVYWDEQQLCFNIWPGTHGEYLFFYEASQIGGVEVIGNIYENPELLDKKDK